MNNKDKSLAHLAIGVVIGALLGAGLATCTSEEANAQSTSGGIQEQINKPLVWNPPKRFDREYEGVLIEHKLPKGQVESYCSKLFSWFHGVEVARDNSLLGCAVQRANFCVIAYIDKPLGFYKPEVIRKHEIGHCNGWSGKHER